MDENPANNPNSQWAFPDDSARLNPEFMHQLFIDGVIGTKEFRSWLAANDPSFERIRDSSVDDEIDRLARDRAEALRAREEPSTP